MEMDLVHQIRIDNRLDSYQTFFDHDWSRKIGTLVGGTKLEEPVFALCMNWKSAANTHALPWLMIESLRGLWTGFMSGHEPFALKTIKALSQRLPSEMADSLSNMNRKKLAKVVRDIGIQVCEATETSKEEFDPQTIWREFLRPDIQEFQLCIWGSQRICYGAIFHAYENFVRQCVGVTKDEPDYRAYFNQLVKDVESTFGLQAAEFCLTEQNIKIARQVRNALAHNGGRITDEIESRPHDLAVEDGVIQIMAPDTKNLFDLLKTRALSLTEAALGVLE